MQQSSGKPEVPGGCPLPRKHASIITSCMRQYISCGGAAWGASYMLLCTNDVVFCVYCFAVDGTYR